MAGEKEAEEDCLGAAFLSPGATDVLGPVTHCSGVCPVYCRPLSSTPGLYPLDVSSISPSIKAIKNVSRCCQMSHGVQDPPVDTTVLHWVFCPPIPVVDSQAGLEAISQQI